jgi:hypothetical protein
MRDRSVDEGIEQASKARSGLAHCQIGDLLQGVALIYGESVLKHTIFTFLG